MTKTKLESLLEKEPLVHLIRRCDMIGVPHTGSKEELIARLLEAEQAESKQAEEPEVEPEVEPPAPEPGEEPPEPEV